MKPNRKYKDSIFRSIFNNKEKLLELLNALIGTNYKDPEANTINTLEDVLFMDRKNDISFIIDDFLVLIEHQSTINNFMASRMSMYFHRLLEKISIDDPEKKYGERGTSKKFPHPILIVLYNGKEDYPAQKTLNLASLFVDKDGFEKVVDTKVLVININKGVNPELELRCKTLAEYIEFIAKVREYEVEHPLNEAMHLAIKYCIENNILREYLIQHSVEVMNMLTAEFNLEEYKQVKYLEGREEGIEEGEKRGQNYVLELMEQGLSYDEIKKKLEKSSKKKHK
jgi:hypothetical protein